MEKKSRIYWDESSIEAKIKEMLNCTKQETFPTHTEIKDFFGDYTLSNAIRRHGGTKYWAYKLGIPEKKCESFLGDEYEQKCVKDIKEKLNLDSEMCKVRYPYDILVARSTKIDIKVSNIFETKEKKTKFFTCNIEKEMQTCDIFVVYCIYDENKEKTFIIPSCELSGKTQISIGIEKSKYDSFIDRWDIIKKYVDFMKECK